jgi:hypothetical protein
MAQNYSRVRLARELVWTERAEVMVRKSGIEGGDELKVNFAIISACSGERAPGKGRL